MKLNLKLLEASFNEQGTYFIKLEFIDVPKTNETLKHRTNVCNLSSKPHFNSDFIVDVDSHKRAKIYLTACEIQKTGYGEPTVISLGSARVYLDPIINTLNREPVYSSIVHFHADPDMSDVGDGIEGKVIGSCALTFSVLKRGPFDYNYSDDNSSEKSSGYARILFKRSLGDVEEFSNPNQKTLQEIHHGIIIFI